MCLPKIECLNATRLSRKTRARGSSEPWSTYSNVSYHLLSCSRQRRSQLKQKMKLVISLFLLCFMDIIPSQFSFAESQDLIERLFCAPIERHILPNGLTLVHRPDFSSEVVSVQIWVKTGSIHEDALVGSGLSHYLEHMLFKGTSRRDGKSISREVHAMGGSINAYTTFDRTVYTSMRLRLLSAKSSMCSRTSLCIRP